MTIDKQTITVRKNWKRALGALAIVLFMVPISAWILYLGLQPGRPDVAWALLIFGVLGLVAFVASAVAVVRVMRSPWHLALTPSQLVLNAPSYLLRVPWQNIVGIAVDQVNRRPGCVLVLEDLGGTVQGATIHGGRHRRDAVTDAETMQARMEESFDRWGYHLALPGRMLELGPEALAELLAQGRQGSLWLRHEGES
ncbi:hypothetical protein ACFLT5_01475 [Chloroflexota bacterium]